jgi:hypothetical protein
MRIKLLAACALVTSAATVLIAGAGPDGPPAGRALLTRSISVTVDSVGTSQVALTNTYDATGNLVVSVRTFDWENDGVVNSSTTVTSTYNAAGALAAAMTASDFDGDGVADTYLKETYSYDDRGNALVFESAADNNADGITDSRFESSTTYNAASQPLVEQFEQDFDNNGQPESVSVRTYTYDQNGRLATVDFKIFNEGVLAGSDVTSYTYNARGQVVTTETDTDFDGTGTFLQHDTVAFTYTIRDDLESHVIQQGPDAESDPYYRESVINEYDGHGRLLKETNEQDYGADGIDIGGTITVYTYDLRGQLMSSARESFGGDLIERQTSIYSYDATGNLIETVSTYTFADLFSIETTRNEY